MKFAFVVHPLGSATQQLHALQPSAEMRQLWGHDLPAFCRLLQDQAQRSRDALSGRRTDDVRVVDELDCVSGVNGAAATGRFYEIPQTPAELLADPGGAADAVLRAVQMAEAWGAQVVGLGALTGTLGVGGAEIAAQATVAITTGNSLTVHAAVENISTVCRELEIDPLDETLAVIGAPGSIASAAARLLAPRFARLLLVGRSASPRLQKLGDEIGAEVCTSIPAALATTRLILTATSSGLCLNPELLQPGSIVWDVAVPADLLPSDRQRSDVLLLSSGLAALPPGCDFRGGYLWLHRGVMPGCLAETLLLAWENRAESFSLGRQLDLARIEQIGQIAGHHRLDFARMYSEGMPLPASTLVQFRQHRRRCEDRASRNTNGSSRDDCGALARRQFGRHMNPVLASVLEHGDLLRTFVRGEDCRLWDANGREYLDFVAGFGSVNLGHNHPQVTAAMSRALAAGAPGFAPGSVNPYAAQLAERLALAAPIGLEVATFVNSGAEAVEAAVKLARAATGRTRLVACDRGYHGKTCGALSVTGHRGFKERFEPLLPECYSIPFGDLPSLRRALDVHGPAAFVVEPVAAEGGIHPLPDGFLQQAATLCRAAGTLLIVDEIQTGLGRTGRLFAVDHEEVAPDILCLAKSLGGGVQPIGAMLCQRSVWMQAYGTLDSCLLQTSTFAGGSLASAAALATLDVLADGAVIENAAARGAELLAGLQSLAERFAVVRSVRGLGLLLGIEFAPLPEVIAEHWLQQSGLMPLLIPNLRERVASLPAFYVMQALLRHHGIFTQLCRSQPQVLRVEPPLTISSEDVRRFLSSLEACVEQIDLSNQMFAACLSKTMRGELDFRAGGKEK